MPSVRRSLAISLASRYALVPLTLASYVVLARLLTPKEIGLYSVAAALIGLAQVVRDFGIGTFLIQEKELTDQHVRSALGISLTIGIGMFLVFVAASPFAAQYYNDAQIPSILRVIALNFLVLPFCSVSISLLRRQMLFGRVAVATMCSAFVGTVSTVTLAWVGWGPASMAWGNMLANISLGLSAWALRTDRKILLPSLSGWSHLFRFGGRSALTQMITTLAIDINDLVVGRVLGFEAVAMLSRAQGIMNIFHQQFMGAVLTVAYPAFAQAHRAGENMETNYIVAVTNTTVFAWPFYGFAALFPLELVHLLLGSQWYEATSLVPIFAAAGAVAATFSLINSWMLAGGRVDLVMRAELVVQSLRIVLIVTAAVVFKSLIACAVAFFLAFAIGAVVFYTVKIRGMDVESDVGALARALWKSGIVSGTCLLMPAVVSFYFGYARATPIALPIFLTTAFVCAMSWAMGIWIFRHPISRESVLHKVINTLKSFR